eukprot:COSAG02_NODE_7204_length_3121_cov_2.780609_3_plen_103_part_00
MSTSGQRAIILQCTLVPQVFLQCSGVEEKIARPNSRALLSFLRMEAEAERKDAAKSAKSRALESPSKKGTKGIERTEETVPHTETNKVDAVRPGALPGQPAP